MRANTARAAQRLEAAFLDTHPALAGTLTAALPVLPGVTPMGHTCWELRHRDGRPVRGPGHFATEQEARAHAKARHIPTQLPHPCWQVTAGCGYVLDEESYAYHFDTPSDAFRCAAEHGWTVVSSYADTWLHCGADTCTCTPGQLTQLTDGELAYLRHPDPVPATT